MCGGDNDDGGAISVAHAHLSSARNSLAIILYSVARANARTWTTIAMCTARACDTIAARSSPVGVVEWWRLAAIYSVAHSKVLDQGENRSFAFVNGICMVGDRYDKCVADVCAPRPGGWPSITTWCRRMWLVRWIAHRYTYFYMLMYIIYSVCDWAAST